jgi:hypothetical protein
MRVDIKTKGKVKDPDIGEAVAGPDVKVIGDIYTTPHLLTESKK